TASIRSGLAASLGDAYTFRSKLIEREAMVRQVRLDLDHVRKNGATEIVVVAHSLGAAVTYDALVDAPAARERVVRLVTVGNALAVLDVASRTHFNSTPCIAPIPDVEWTDFYTSFDPVPVGELGFTGTNAVTPPPSSTRVSNEQSMIRDHSAYFVNGEEVMGVVVGQLLDACAPEDTCSDFPRRLKTAADLRHHRKNAQSALVMLFAAATFAAALTLSTGEVQDLGRRVYDLTNGLLGPLPDPLETPLKSWLHGSTQLWLLGAVVVAFVGVVVYRLTVRTAWTAWDRKARNQLASTETRLYEPAQLWYVLGVLIPIAAGIVGLVLRARYGLAMTHYTRLAAIGLVVTLAAEVSIVLATHLTLKSKDLEPSGFALKVHKSTGSTPQWPEGSVGLRHPALDERHAHALSRTRPEDTRS
ncbi:MAG: alpha/beta fold hydrolase, partial [Acidimicrobiales bacterium]